MYLEPDYRVASFKGGSISLQFAKHVDLTAWEPNKVRHIWGKDCPACTRTYEGKHRKDTK